MRFKFSAITIKCGRLVDTPTLTPVTSRFYEIRAYPRFFFHSFGRDIALVSSSTILKLKFPRIYLLDPLLKCELAFLFFVSTGIGAFSVVTLLEKKGFKQEILRACTPTFSLNPGVAGQVFVPL